MTAVAEQEAAAARMALPIEARRQAARVMYAESVSAGMPMTAREVGAAFGRGERWGRDRMTEVRTQNADPADFAETADRAEEAVEVPITAADTADMTQPDTTAASAATAVVVGGSEDQE